MEETNLSQVNEAVFPAGIKSTNNKLKTRNLVNSDNVLSEISEDELKALQISLDASIVKFIDANIPVYLERLGIIFPEISSRIKVKCIRDKNMIYHESIKSLNFEKCYDLVTYHKEIYKGVVSTKELAADISMHLPSFIKWDEKKLQRYIRALVLLIKKDLICNGGSRCLESVGTFYSLHNRQGQNLSDWFAGADIFVDPHYRKTISITENKIFQKPVFLTAWELLQAEFGKPIKTCRLDLLSELYQIEGEQKLNLDQFRSKFSAQINPNYIDFAVFKVEQVLGGSKERYLFCTDGIRKLVKDPNVAGTEFIFQVEIDRLDREQAKLIDSGVENIANRAFALAWILLNSSKAKTLRLGMGLESPLPLFKQTQSPIDAIFCTKFSRATTEQLSPEGKFIYFNIAGITEDEAKACSQISAEFLYKFLSYKKFDQLTRPFRLSVLHKTILLEKIKAEENISDYKHLQG